MHTLNLQTDIDGRELHPQLDILAIPGESQLRLVTQQAL
jgi:hypothetical protein